MLQTLSGESLRFYITVKSDFVLNFSVILTCLKTDKVFSAFRSKTDKCPEKLSVSSKWTAGKRGVGLYGIFPHKLQYLPMVGLFGLALCLGKKHRLQSSQY